MSDKLGNNVEDNSEGFKRAKTGIKELAVYPDIPIKEFNPQEIRDRNRAEQEEITRSVKILSEISEPNLSTVNTAKRTEKRTEEKRITKRNRFMLAASAGLLSITSLFGLLKGVQHEAPNFSGDRQTPKREAEKNDEVTKNIKANQAAGTELDGLDNVSPEVPAEASGANQNAADNMEVQREADKTGQEINDGLNPEDR